MSVPAYTPPTITAAGLTVSSYQAILADNIQAAFLNPYGQNQYVGEDSAIYEMLSILSLKQADCHAALQFVYNQLSPQTAVGTGLDRSVKMNGLDRAGFTYSSVVLTLTGTAGATITNGAAQDTSGNLWSLPSPYTFSSGPNYVTATCTTPGNVTAEPGTVNIIATPASGWLTVTNAAAATPGEAVEQDSQLRARQSISVALPARTPVAATVAAILATPGVTRTAPGYPTPGGPGSSIENPTAATDSWGNPQHSITMVVEGGTDLAVANTIYSKKTIGCFTNGTTSVLVTDPVTGYQCTISFYRPSSMPVGILISVHGLAGFTSATLVAIQSYLVSYLKSLAIGESVVYSELYGAALTARSNPDQPTFSIWALTSGVLTAATTCATTLGSANIVVASNAGLVIGNTIIAAGIPTGATISNITGTTITLSANATVSATGVAASFFSMGTSDLVLPFYAAAYGAALNVVVTSV
jgi:uncharacterized phage protein gp47/JayE